MKQLGNAILYPEVFQNSNSLLELWTEVIAEQIWPLLTERDMQPLCVVLAPIQQVQMNERNEQWRKSEGLSTGTEIAQILVQF